MLNFKALFSSIFLLSFLFSCRPNTELKGIVKNNSTHDMLVVLESDSHYVNANSEKEIIFISEYGSPSYGDHCNYPANSIAIKPKNNSLALTRDPQNASNWIFTFVDSKNKGLYNFCECTFTVSDSDIK